MSNKILRWPRFNLDQDQSLKISPIKRETEEGMNLILKTINCALEINIYKIY